MITGAFDRLELPGKILKIIIAYQQIVDIAIDAVQDYSRMMFFLHEAMTVAGLSPAAAFGALCSLHMVVFAFSWVCIQFAYRVSTMIVNALVTVIMLPNRFLVHFLG